jgi:hypothetical protein
MYPPAVLSETRIIDICSCIVTGVGVALGSSIGGTVDREIVTFGEIVWDQCDCGQLAVTVKQMYPSNFFPNDDSNTRSNCGQPLLVIKLGVSVVRCVPVPDENGVAPEPTELRDASYIAMSDAFIVRETVRCILQGWYDAAPQLIADFNLGAQMVAGPQGGCGGTELDVAFALFIGCEC